MRAQAFTILAAASSALAQTQYTATGTKDVYAAQATAKTRSPTSNVKGKVFDRLAIIWLENTDYELAIGDRMNISLPIGPSSVTDSLPQQTLPTWRPRVSPSPTTSP